MKPVDPSVYRAALDRIDVMRRALRQIAAMQVPRRYSAAPEIARDALAAVSTQHVTRNLDLEAAAAAVIERWETPLWKDVEATSVFIGALRAALEREQ